MEKITLGHVMVHLAKAIQENPAVGELEARGHIMGIDDQGLNRILLMFQPNFDKEAAIKEAVASLVADPDSPIGKKIN